ncbi:6-pyruvoyl tetrahydropterin synthase family protein [Acidobacteriota bacterium]
MSWILKVKSKFQAAHFLENYKGKCERVHGHTFHVEAEIKVTELDRAGIGIDFTGIKKKLDEILPDHTHLNEVYDFPPSAENISRHLFDQLKEFFPITKLTVWESEDASATYSED